MNEIIMNYDGIRPIKSKVKSKEVASQPTRQSTTTLRSPHQIGRMLVT